MRKHIRGIFAALILLTAVAVVYAAMASEFTFVNELKTGSVAVQIRQYELKHGKLRPAEPGIVMANQDVSYVPEITNLRAPSYVRVKVDVLMDKDIREPVTIDNVRGLGEEWVRKGDYFYYKKPMKPMESAYLFKSVHIPAGWTGASAAGFRMQLTVDAVQAYGMHPDFDSQNPWGMIQIQEEKPQDNIIYRDVYPVVKGEEHVLKISKAGELECDTRDLFSNFDYFMAGSVFRDELVIRNENDKDVTVYFQAYPSAGTLVDDTSIEISMNNKIVYSGVLSDVPIKRYAELTRIPAGEGGVMEFRLELPEKADNELSVLADQVTWKFRVEFDEGSSAKTGDLRDMEKFKVSAALALIAGVVLIVTGKRGRKNGEN